METVDLYWKWTNKILKYLSLVFIEIKLENIDKEHISDHPSFPRPTRRV